MKKLLVINSRQDIVISNRDGRVRTYRNAERAAKLVDKITDSTLDIGKFLSGNIEVTNDLEFAIFDAAAAAKALRAIPSDKRTQASRDNGKKGGRPKKIQE